MLTTGHRGASATQPENTMAAFKQALAMGAEAIELDIQRCRSGEMVVMHDADVSRTTDGNGLIKDMTLAELKALKLPNGENIATLDETLAELKGGCRNGSNPTIFIEIKSNGAKSTAASIRNAVEQHGYGYGELPVIGFNPKQVGLVKACNPKVEIGLSMSAKRTAHEIQKLIPLAKLMRASAINPEHTLVTAELVDKAHAAGLKVNTWTVNEHADIKRVTEAGVDNIMSDYPDRVKRIAQAVAKPAPIQERTL